MTRAKAPTSTMLTSRAVTRIIEKGFYATCVQCRQPVRYRGTNSRTKQQVIANVYVDGVWDRVEHYHLDCYETAGRPYGPAS